MHIKNLLDSVVRCNKSVQFFQAFNKYVEKFEHTQISDLITRNHKCYEMKIKINLTFYVKLKVI